MHRCTTVRNSHCVVKGNYTRFRGVTGLLRPGGDQVAGKRAETRKIPGLGDRIRSAREQWGGYGEIGKTRFAEVLGVGVQSLYEYETGKALPSAWVIWRVANVTGVSTEWLLRGNESPALRSPRALIQQAARRMLHDPSLKGIGDDLRRRYADRVRYITKQFLRMIYDIEEFLEQAKRHSQDREFKAEEYRRDWLADFREEGEDRNG